MSRNSVLRRVLSKAASVVFVVSAILFFRSHSEAGLLYVLNDDSTGSRIYGFQVNESTGALTALAGFPVATGGTGGTGLVCERMAIDVVNRRLFVVNDGADTVSAYSIDPSTGALTAMPFSPIAIGTGTWNAMAIHPNGSPLVISNGATGGGAVSLNITATTATPATGSPFPLGAATAFSNTFSSDGNYYYTGGNTGTAFAGFSVDAATGVLTPLAGSPFSSGQTGPLAYAMDPSGRLFVLNSVDFAIRVFTTSSGIPSGVTGNPFTSGLTQRRDGLMHNNNNFYIVAGNSGNNVGVYQIAGTGAGTTVTPVSGSPFPTGGTTANVLALNQAGTFLFVGNRLSRNITTFAFNPSTGVLSGQTVQASNTMGTTGAVNGIGYLPDSLVVNAQISGRITNAAGLGIAKVYVQLTSMDASVRRLALTNAFGYYSFPSVQTGTTYTLTPTRRAYTFSPTSIVRNHTGDAVDLNFIGSPDKP